MSTAGPFRRSPSVCLLLNGSTVEVDLEIAPAIAKLNDLGVATRYCCAGIQNIRKPGTHSDLAYIVIDEGDFPAELKLAWANAGYVVSSNEVYVYAPSGYRHIANQRFVRSLHDWVSETLDVSGARYRIPRKRPAPLRRRQSRNSVGMRREVTMADDFERERLLP